MLGLSKLMFLHVDGQLVVLAPFLKKTSLAPLYVLFSVIQNQLTVFIWVCFWAPYFIQFIYFSIFFPNTTLPWLLQLYSKSWSYVVSLYNLFLSFNIVLAILGLFLLHIKFRVQFWYSKNNLLRFWLGLHWIRRSS